MSEIVYLNGEFLEKEQAKISPNDRGFIFADGVYEVAKYYNGKAFRYKDHLDRLERSLAELNIHYSETDKLDKVFTELLVRNNMLNKHAGIYLQITRGVEKRVHHFPVDIIPTVYAFAFDLPSATDKLQNGIKVITEEDIRWQRCDIKSVSLLPNTMLYNKAVESGAGECILIRDGKVTEATHSSVLAVKNNKLITRPLSNLILPGITRKVVLEICSANNIPVEERLFTKEELYNMDELFISGTGSEITPVIQVDNVRIGDGEAGKITRFLQQKFFEMVS
ncbi:D-amino-acid transaminase [uncultured Draconibacterium sp.]|uniref:D-amino-acid transaminase n=1 Tax=uncultured Draconibacterium sp. TaxID=1573823 RepID=UPI0032169B85